MHVFGIAAKDGITQLGSWYVETTLLMKILDILRCKVTWYWLNEIRQDDLDGLGGQGGGIGHLLKRATGREAETGC